jgi:D-lyxose ketol-isomerase
MKDKYPKMYAEKILAMYPGQSITITPYLFHEFIMPKDGGMTLIGEVSECNDDDHDNYWLDNRVGRFPEVDEDEAPYRLLCTEYAPAE